MARAKRDLPVTALIDTEQVAEMLQEAGLTDLTKKWVQNQADRKELPYVIIARKRRFRKDLIESMIKGWCNQAA